MLILQHLSASLYLFRPLEQELVFIVESINTSEHAFFSDIKISEHLIDSFLVV